VDPADLHHRRDRQPGWSEKSISFAAPATFGTLAACWFASVALYRLTVNALDLSGQPGCGRVATSVELATLSAPYRCSAR
jgi:hypothetical protein